MITLRVTHILHSADAMHHAAAVAGQRGILAADAGLACAQAYRYCTGVTRKGWVNRGPHDFKKGPPARPEECFVQDVWPVGACQDHHACGGLKPVHLHQQLVQSVLSLVVASSKAAAPSGSPNGINLIYTPVCKRQQALQSATASE